MRICSIWNYEILIEAFPTPDSDIRTPSQCLTELYVGPGFSGRVRIPAGFGPKVD